MNRFLILIFIPTLLAGQTVKRSILKANSFFYKQNIYVYGLEKTKNVLQFKVFKFSNTLQKSDSVQFSLGNDNPDNYLDINSDSLYGYLNFYLQKADNKNQVTLIRLNDSLRTMLKADNVEVTKLNSLTAFESEKYIFRNSTYIIRSSGEHPDKQFFLTKFDITDPKKINEFKQAWQFPFEKKFIREARVFYADSEVVLVTTNIFEGEKKGQWLIKVNARNGQLLSGKRISIANDKRAFLYSGFHYNKETKEIMLAGNIYTENQLNLGAATYSFSPVKNNLFFFVVIDSTNEYILRAEKNLPLAVISATTAGKSAKKEVFNYHLKIKGLTKRSPFEYLLYVDIYKNTAQSLSFLYETGFNLTLNLNNDEVELVPDKIYNSTSIVPGIVVADPKDINGKFDLKSIEEYPKFLCSTPISDAERCYGRDEQQNPKWILRKNDLKTNKTSFYHVTVGAKGLQSKLMLENDKYTFPNIYSISSQKILLFNFDSGIFELSLTDW